MTDLASAQRAVEEILEQGEGPRGDWRDAHFGQFVNILDEYQQLRAANPGFDPVRPVLAANVRPHERDADHPLISDPLTARVTDLFNVVLRDPAADLRALLRAHARSPTASSRCLPTRRSR